jgi:hydroxymethylbilane synthase
VRIRIGTRGSALALAQAGEVARRLGAAGHETETVVIHTEGDRVADRPFAEVGAFGVFVREIEAALLEGRVDVAVHSYKDLPSQRPAELVVAAAPERVDVADVLLARREATAPGGVIPLREGATVGTSSARRQAQLRHLRPDLAHAPLRGNVPTRIRSLAEGRFDAIVLAAAGLLRLQRNAPGGAPLVPDGIVTTRLDPAVFVPAPGQGALAVQVRRDDDAVRRAVEPLDDPATARALAAERAALARAEAGCVVPFGAWCRVKADGRLLLVAVLGGADGVLSRAEASGEDPDALAEAVWRGLQGAREE